MCILLKCYWCVKNREICCETIFFRLKTSMLCKPFHLRQIEFWNMGIRGKHFEITGQNGRYLWYHIYIIKYILYHLRWKTTGGLHQNRYQIGILTIWRQIGVAVQCIQSWAILGRIQTVPDSTKSYSDGPGKIQNVGKTPPKISNLHGKFCEMQ